MSNKATRGIRNNNPGNIRKSKDKWQGLAEEQPDKEFFTFVSAVYGIRALARVLITYQDKHNLHTIEKIISRWAPPSENNTKAYIKSVCDQTGFDAKEELDMHSFEHLEPLVKAIIHHENGQQPYKDAEITKGLVLAGVEPPVAPLAKTGTMKAAKAGVVGAGTIGVAAEAVDQLAPAIPLMQTALEYAPWAMVAALVTAIGYMAWRRYDDRRKGLR